MSAGGTKLEVPGGRLTFEVRGSGPCWPVSRRPCGGGPADLLPDAAHIRTVVDDAADAYRAPGGPAAPAPSAKQPADDGLFFLLMPKPFTRYQPEVEALRAGGPTVVVAVGQTSAQEVVIRSALTLAERLARR